jgi:flavin reductase (DIM6/NTAB) family NADH-FMN oxidoreductase RutF
MIDSPDFVDLSRQQFRGYFQPSSLVMCILPAPATESGINVITLSFCTHCSYKPPMMAIAIQNINDGYRLVQHASEFVLAVPGEDMVREAMACGTDSAKDADKVRSLMIQLVPSDKIKVPGLARAIANIELQKKSTTECGDHLLVVGEVLKYGVNQKKGTRPLLSVGPDTGGYRVLLEQGIHRSTAVISGEQNVPRPI